MAEIKLKRKAFRMVGLLFPLAYAAGDLALPGAGWIAASGILVLFLGIVLAVESWRFRRPGVNRWIFDRLGSFTKEKERGRLSSTTMFLFACLLTIAIFGRSVAIAAMIMLLFGDPVAELVGVRHGRIPLMGKTLEGTLAGFVACLLVTAPLAALPMGLTWIVLAGGAAAAALVELLPLPLDDNLVIPIGAGTAMTLLQSLTAQAGRAPMSPLVEMALRSLQP